MIPRPLQCGQYPCGELNENECGAGSARDMPVSGLPLVKVLGPFHDLTILADLQRLQLGQHFFQLLNEFPVLTESIGRVNVELQQFPDDAGIHGRTGADIGLAAVGGAHKAILR